MLFEPIPIEAHQYITLNCRNISEHRRVYRIAELEVLFYILGFYQLVYVLIVNVSRDCSTVPIRGAVSFV